MEKLDPKTHGGSPDLVTENMAQLRQLFPDVFSEDKVDPDALRHLLGDYVNDQVERYGLSWTGKGRARQIAQTPSNGTLRPARDESFAWDTTQNIFVEGDNLEVLKLLQKSYHRRVKVIYIDPPYNTGKEFIYPDKYQDNLYTYLRYTGQVNGEGLKISTNAETNGRYHTNWLNMMHPRLKLARNLLRDDGVIFVSIDDYEVHNLRHLLDETFGPENFIAQLVWEKTRKNDAKFFSVGHEYIVVYARDLLSLREAGTVWREPKEGAHQIVLKYNELRSRHGDDNQAIQEDLRAWYRDLPNGHPSKALSRYKHVDDRGIWRDRDISWPGGDGPRYDVVHPGTGIPCAIPEAGWRFSKPEKMREQIEAGLVVFRDDHTQPPFCKAYLFDGNDEDEEHDEDTPSDSGEECPNAKPIDPTTAGLQVMPSVIFRQSQVAAKYLKRLMGKKVFDNPKDHEVLSRLIQYTTGAKGRDIVLDFFAGSGTTGDSVMRANCQDGGDRRFLLVQLPEKTERPDYPTIAEITKARLRAAAKAIAEEFDGSLLTPTQSDGVDLGYRAFRLDSTNVQPWDGEFDNLEPNLLAAVDNVKLGRSEDDVLFELLLKYGLDLSLPVEERTVAGKRVFILGAGALVICLASGVTLAVVEGIGALRKELQPEVMRVVFRDTSFKDDVVKTNAVQILKRAGIDDIKSL